MNLFSVLENISIRTEKEIKFVNSGGCGCFAAIVARELERHGIRCGGIIIDSGAYDGPDINDMLANINPTNLHDLNRNNIWVDHMILTFMCEGERWFYDSRTLTNNFYDFSWSAWDGHLPLETMEMLAYSPEGWNSMFNRNLIPRINEIVKQEFLYLN